MEIQFAICRGGFTVDDALVFSKKLISCNRKYSHPQIGQNKKIDRSIANKIFMTSIKHRVLTTIDYRALQNYVPAQAISQLPINGRPGLLCMVSTVSTVHSGFIYRMNYSMNYELWNKDEMLETIQLPDKTSKLFAMLLSLLST